MKMRLNPFYITTFCIAVFFGFISGCSTSNPSDAGGGQSRPNIILFVSDDHGTDALGCYGNPVIETPNLDRLAVEGVKFNNAYCTSASCAASRSVILTGKFGHATGSYGHVHDLKMSLHCRYYLKMRGT